MEFGLGSATTIDSLIVRWPSGTRRVVTPPDVSTVVTVEEEPGTQVPEPIVPARFALYQNIPNPFNPVTVIRYDLPDARVVTLKVFDVSGRLVRVLRDGALEQAAAHMAAWDGRDETGRRVSSGVYFYRIHAGPDTETKGMVLLK